MNPNVKLILFALLATAIALKADIGNPPLADDLRSYVSWVLSGMIAGISALLGPEAAERVRGMFKSPD